MRTEHINSPSCRNAKTTQGTQSQSQYYTVHNTLSHKIKISLIQKTAYHSQQKYIHHTTITYILPYPTY